MVNVRYRLHLAIAILFVRILCVKCDPETQELAATHCRQLAGSAARGACDAFATAADARGRLCSALAWKTADLPSYHCSGINDACLAAESRESHRRGHLVRVCSPLPAGSPCGSPLFAMLQPRCAKGVCRDEAGQSVTAPELPHSPVRSPARLTGGARIQRLPRAAAAEALASTLHAPAARASAAPAVAGAASGAPGLLAITVDTSAGALGTAVPEAFLGISLEWQGIEHYAGGPSGHIAPWAALMRALGPGIVLRIGGASQDKLREVPGDAAWRAMAALHEASGARFIIGLPLNGNNASLQAGMLAAARRVLPPSAVYGYELGNEPVYWDCPGLGGWDHDGVFAPGWEAFVSYFEASARRLGACRGRQLGPGGVRVIGPAWDNLNTFSASRRERVLTAAARSCYLDALSVHAYPYYAKNKFDHVALLSEDLARELARNVSAHVRGAAEFGKLLRVTEANSLSSAGEQGTSDAFAAALWTADTAFEFAAAGVASLHFHNGHGGLPGASVEAGVPLYAAVRTMHLEGGVTAPQTRAPLAGLLLFQAAIAPAAAAAVSPGLLGPAPSAGGSAARRPRITRVTAAAATPGCGDGRVKVWPVLHPAAAAGGAASNSSSSNEQGQLRVVLLNKSDRHDCVVSLLLAGQPRGVRHGVEVPGAVLRVAAIGGMAGKDVRWGGARWADLSGRLTGEPEWEAAPSRNGAHELLLPAASAALLVLRGRAMPATR